MPRLKALFFCGDKSRYGQAHLVPLLKSQFDILAVIVAAEDRWRLFHEALSGKCYYEPNNFIRKLSTIILKKFINLKIIYSLIKRKIQDIENILSISSIPFWRVFDVNDENFIDKLKELKTDLIISAAYPQIFSKNLLTIAEKGCINFHPSLLPKYRGAHPHFWAIAKGETEWGITAHFMTNKIDDGDIVAQLKFPINECTYNQLYEKIIEQTPKLIEMVEEFFYCNCKKAMSQKTLESSCFRNDREIHKRIFWNIHTAEEIKNLIRTQQAFCFFRLEKVKPLRSYITDTNRNLTNGVQVECGTIVDIYKDSVVIKAKNGCINIEELELNGRKISFMEWIIRRKVSIGEKFI